MMIKRQPGSYALVRDTHGRLVVAGDRSKETDPTADELLADFEQACTSARTSLRLVENEAAKVKRIASRISSTSIPVQK